MAKKKKKIVFKIVNRNRYKFEVILCFMSVKVAGNICGQLQLWQLA